MEPPVVITGASSGIGLAIETRLRSAGFRVLNLDITPSRAEPESHIPCDLNEPELITNAIKRLPNDLAGLICVAGVGPIAEDPEKVVRINFLGTRYLTEALLPRIRLGGGVTLIASSAGRDWADNRQLVDGLISTTAFAEGLDWLSKNHAAWSGQAYKFSKQCLAAYTYHAAGKAMTLGVRVNCINPGITQTRLSTVFRAMIGNEKYDRITRLSGRSGQPEDLAGLTEFLTVGDATWINGVEITVDGGYHAGVIAGWHPE